MGRGVSSNRDGSSGRRTRRTSGTRTRRTGRARRTRKVRVSSRCGNESRG